MPNARSDRQKTTNEADDPNREADTPIPGALNSAESGSPVRSSEVVSRLHQNYLKWEKLAREAATQMLDAELAFKDAEREREGAWVKYYNARNELRRLNHERST